MTERSVIHDTFVIERTYPASPSRVFAAFASKEADIVPGQRLVYSYEMYSGDTRISVSVATIEFAPTPDRTSLTWTEQGAYLDGIHGQDAPRLRHGGTADLLDTLAKSLDAVRCSVLTEHRTKGKLDSRGD